jgi:hypothetical protein
VESIKFSPQTHISPSPEAPVAQQDKETERQKAQIEVLVLTVIILDPQSQRMIVGKFRGWERGRI